MMRYLNPGAVVGALLILAVRMYKLCVSPVLPASCRFYPTCSEYAMIALKRYGPLRGTCLALKRVLRCNPFCEGGYDPVP